MASEFASTEVDLEPLEDIQQAELGRPEPGWGDAVLSAGKGAAAYSAAKAAELHMARCLAEEGGAFGIRVNSVHPGGMYTEMGGSARSTLEELNRDVYANFPIPRVGLPEEVAQVILFLATDEGSYCTGSEFVADGGWFAGMRNPRMPSS